MRRLDGRKCRTGDLFKAAADKLTDAGFVRTAEPARQRFKKTLTAAADESSCVFESSPGIIATRIICLSVCLTPSVCHGL